MDAFESLMRKKLGGKYVKPSFIDDEAKPEDKTKLANKTKLDDKTKLDGMAKLDDKDTQDIKSSEDGDKADGEKSGQLTPPPKSVSNDITLTTPAPPKTSTPVEGGKRRANLVPRVSCGECDSIGIQGKEMDVYKIKKHKQKKPCDECQFCLLYTSPSPRDATLSRMPSSA